jgi:hypothetical protein
MLIEELYEEARWNGVSAAKALWIAVRCMFFLFWYR